jgi:hypothetical protein
LVLICETEAARCAPVGANILHLYRLCILLSFILEETESKLPSPMDLVAMVLDPEVFASHVPVSWCGMSPQTVIQFCPHLSLNGFKRIDSLMLKQAEQ